MQANKKAFTHSINAKGSSQDEGFNINQSSPAWVLTFVQWQYRDTLRMDGVNGLQVASATSISTIQDPQNTDSRFGNVVGPLVVENDCLQCSVTTSKGTLTPNMTATLVMTDVNYETAISPGDFVMVNMLNWETNARRVADNARAKKPINGQHDGFKGVFKVQSVRKTLGTDPATGTRIMVFKITGFAFTEFNNTIYFNPYLVSPQDNENQLLFQTYISKDWEKLVNKKATVNVQDIIALLIQSFIGTGIDNSAGTLNTQKSGLNTPNTVHFFMPSLIGSLLGLGNISAAKDIYSYIFGTQQYSTGTNLTLASGMNPSNIISHPFTKFSYTNTPCSGDTFLAVEYWNQVKAWSIINQYTNAPLNEIYTCFRISPTGSVLPTVIFRQIPFTNEDFPISSQYGELGLNVTHFMNLPRWTISPALVTDLDIGRDEVARINFMQYFGRSVVSKTGAEIADEIIKKNYVADYGDIQRSGLKPYIVTTILDTITDQYKSYKSPLWAKIVGDAVIGGHLKMNGTIVCVGIADPITVGDNFQFDGVVYHIESVSHTAQISPGNGVKIFRTTLSLSHGISVTSSAQGTRYPEMTWTNAYEDRANDWTRDKIIPGVSETQDTVYRPDNPEPANPNSVSQNYSFPQPQGPAKKGKVTT